MPFLVLGITNFSGHTHGSHYQPPTSFIAVAPLLVSYGDSGCHGYFSWTWRPLVLRTLDCLACRCLWSGLSLCFIFLLAGSEGLVSFCPHQYLKFHPYLSSLPLFLSFSLLLCLPPFSFDPCTGDGTQDLISPILGKCSSMDLSL